MSTSTPIRLDVIKRQGRAQVLHLCNRYPNAAKNLLMALREDTLDGSIDSLDVFAIIANGEGLSRDIVRSKLREVYKSPIHDLLELTPMPKELEETGFFEIEALTYPIGPTAFVPHKRRAIKWLYTQLRFWVGSKSEAATSLKLCMEVEKLILPKRKLQTKILGGRTWTCIASGLWRDEDDGYEARRAEKGELWEVYDFNGAFIGSTGTFLDIPLVVPVHEDSTN